MDKNANSICLFIFTTGNIEKFSNLLESIAKSEIQPYFNLQAIVFNYGQKNNIHSYKDIIKEFSEYLRVPCQYKYKACNNFARAANSVVRLSKKNNFKKIIFIHDSYLAGPDWLNLLIENISKYEANIIFGPTYNLWPINTKKYLIPALEASQHTYDIYIPFQIASPYNASFDIKMFSGDKAFHFDEAHKLEGFEDSDLSLFLTKNDITKVFVENAIAIHKLDQNVISLKKIFIQNFKFGIQQSLLSKKFTNSKIYLFATSCVNFLFDIVTLPFAILGRSGSFIKKCSHLIYIVGNIFGYIK